MISKRYICVALCVGLLSLHVRVPAVSARRAGARDDSYLVDADLRTDLDLRTDVTDPSNYVGLDYDAPAPLPEFILDYANMIRNDIILLDNSVETRTRKRGNIKVKKQATLNVPCNCERTYSNAEDYRRNNYKNLSEVLGSGTWFPSTVRNVTCDESKCAKSYRCRKIIYEMAVLKRSSEEDDRTRAGQLFNDMANELKFKWVPQMVPVVTGCLCSSTFLAN